VNKKNTAADSTSPRVPAKTTLLARARSHGRLAIVIAAIAAASAPNARAGFSVVKAPPPPPAPASTAHGLPVAYSALTQLGREPVTVDTRFGFGRDIPFADALQQIAPAGWHAQSKPSMAGKFDKARKVSWKGGKPWTQVLDDVAMEQGISVTVDWDKQVIAVGDRSERPNQQLMAARQVAPAAPPPPEPPKVWQAPAGQSLKEAAKAWADRAGYSLVWVPKDLNYTFPAPMTEHGDFITATTRLFDNYLEAERPMKIKFYPDQRLAVVVEKP
jgi:hypothetical protein